MDAPRSFIVHRRRGNIDIGKGLPRRLPLRQQFMTLAPCEQARACILGRARPENWSTAGERLVPSIINVLFHLGIYIRCSVTSRVLYVIYVSVVVTVVQTPPL